MKILFPRNTGQRYYGAHYRYLLNVFKYLELDVELYESELTIRGFIIRIDGKRALIDFSNFLAPADGEDVDIYFKYEYSKEHCEKRADVYPMSKISFHDWDEYFKLEKMIKYKCNTDRILNNQRARRGAQARRLLVRKMLSEKYDNLVDFEHTNHLHFWMKINSCLVSVCVPGQRNDILDRGQFQYMAFGACTVSPRLKMVLPFMREVEPGIHYIECKEDYSDLIDIIELCRHNREACVKIGENAKKLFIETSTPFSIWHWMNTVLIKENKEIAS